MSTWRRQGHLRRERIHGNAKKCSQCGNMTWTKCTWCLRPICVRHRYVVRLRRSRLAKPRGPWICLRDCNPDWKGAR